MRRNLQQVNLKQLRDKAASLAVFAGLKSRLRRSSFFRMCFSMCHCQQCFEHFDRQAGCVTGEAYLNIVHRRNKMNVQYFFIHEIRDVLFAYRVSSRLAASQFGRINNIILSTLEDLHEMAATRNRTLYLAGFPNENRTLDRVSNALSAVSAA